MAELQSNLTWEQAKALAAQGVLVRPWEKIDRWYFHSLALWWVTPLNFDGAFPTRVVRAGDFGLAQFVGQTWTTMWPDQGQCIVDPPPPPVPGVFDSQQHSFSRQAPNAEFHLAPGFPTHTVEEDVYGRFTWRSQSVPTRVQLVGTATGGPLLLNGRAVAAPGPGKVTAVNHSFLLPAGKTFITSIRLQTTTIYGTFSYVAIPFEILTYGYDLTATYNL